jgi:hypothetical protein
LKFFLSFELWILSLGSLWAAVPTLDHLYPVAAQSGTTNVVIAIGKFDPWPPKVWVDAPGILFQAETNKGKFTVAVASTAPVGPHLVRVFNAEGSSRPRFFIVAHDEQTAEQEPNNEFAAPQEIVKLPASINGRLDKPGDVDSFGVALTAGQTLIASVQASVLASPLDALIRVTDRRGVQLAWNHDNGRTLDPFVAFTARESGRYIVQVMGFPYPATSDVRLHGGESCVYRLQLSPDPFLSHTLPLGVQRGARTGLHLFGWNFSKETLREFDFDGMGLEGSCSTTTLRVPGVCNTIELSVGAGPELIEAEPNNIRAEANLLPLPSAVTGCIDSALDQDRFAFSADKDLKLHLQIQAASLGFPIDPWLKIEDVDGKELVRADDNGSPDPKLDWTAPTNGTFYVVVGNVLHRGGSNFLYHLALLKPQPDFKSISAQHAVAMKPGTTNDAKITVTRLNGFKDRLTVSVAGLSEGVSMAPVEAPEGSGDVTLKFIAVPNTPPTNTIVQIHVANDVVDHTAKFQLTGSTEDNGVPGGFRELLIPETDQIWFTVQAATNLSTNAPEAKP